MADPRGNLMLTFGAIAAKYRPRWLVWENVPGVLSSNGGRDFGAFLGLLGELGYGFAYRVLDAQHFGVPQRRRRVFVVGCLGDWRSAAAVLFERHSLSGHPAPSREAREGTAGTLAGGARKRGGYSHDDIPAVAGTLTGGASMGGMGPPGGRLQGAPYGHLLARCDTTGEGRRQDAETCTLVTHDLTGEGFDASEDGTGRGTPLIPIAFDCKASGQNGFGVGDIASTQRAMGHAGSHTNGGGHQAVAFQPNTCENIGFLEGDSDGPEAERNAISLLCRVRQAVGAQALSEWGLGILGELQSAEVLRSALHGAGFRQAAFSRRWLVCCSLGSPFSRAEGAMHSLREAFGEGCPPQGWGSLEQLADELGAYLSQLSQPGAQAERFMRNLWAADEGPWLLRKALSAVQKIRRSAADEGQSAHRGMQVRRLTVEECEFLQGFPRNYTLIPHRGKPAADGPRYKSLGNSWAVPVIAWVGHRIELVDGILKQEGRHAA